jgi:hypothetical protein
VFITIDVKNIKEKSSKNIKRVSKDAVINSDDTDRTTIIEKQKNIFYLHVL